jgi:hypothetical protein
VSGVLSAEPVGVAEYFTIQRRSRVSGRRTHLSE